MSILNWKISLCSKLSIALVLDAIAGNHDTLKEYKNKLSEYQNIQKEYDHTKKLNEEAAKIQD